MRQGRDAPLPFLFKTSDQPTGQRVCVIVQPQRGQRLLSDAQVVPQFEQVLQAPAVAVVPPHAYRV